MKRATKLQNNSLPTTAHNQWNIYIETKKNLNQLCVCAMFWYANWERIQICNVIYMAILYSICVFVLSLSLGLCARFYVLCWVLFLFYYLVVSSKAIYWFDLRSFPNRILLCVFSSVHIGIQLFFVVVGLVIDCYCMQFSCCCCYFCCCICSCWESECE